MKAKHVQIPAGYSSWLDYAVENFDTRSVQLESMFDIAGDLPDREAIRDAARAELEHLRARLRAALGE